MATLICPSFYISGLSSAPCPGPELPLSLSEGKPASALPTELPPHFKTHLLSLGKDAHEVAVRKRKTRGSKRGRGSSGELVLKRIEDVVFPYALKHFLSATNLSTAHGSCARVRLAFSLFFSPAVLTGWLGANHRWKVKGQQSSTIHFFNLDLYIRSTFYLSNETQQSMKQNERWGTALVSL